MSERLAASARRGAARSWSVSRPRSAARLVCAAAGLAALCLLLVSCTQVRYIAQAGVGQLSMAWRAESLEDAAFDARKPWRTRALLREVPHIKRFGERHGLTPTGNYRTYVELDRPAAVWVVSACEPLRFRSKTWSFPIVGTVPYMGWFDLKDAKAFAAPLKAAGWDVDVRPAGAYSTLGWLEDPVLSTMISDGDEALGDLANVVLHESLHATLYVKGQTRLNESLASFVGDELTKHYLDERVGPFSAEKTAYMREMERSEVRTRALHAAYVHLNRLYASPAPDAEKRAEKDAVLARLKADIGARRPINNASLVQFRVYNSGTPELRALLATCGGSWPRFLGALRRLERHRFSEPQENIARVVEPLIEAGCR
ncbi:aminopeptidase [Sorangium sp. So ce327]|jgi:predicted aminopeptidase|uniref:aminopeptidase n=1 Tax=Sorangium sp. So ce327 TaxID=3133301 RepID=UPI003F63507A